MAIPLTRNKSMLELSGISKAAGTNDQVRSLLELQSATETQTQITDLFTPMQANVATISGSQVALSASFTTLNSDMLSLSGNLETDFSNLDLSLNAQIVEISGSVSTMFDTTATTATSGGLVLPAGPEGYIIIVVNGANKKVPFYAV